MKGSKKLVTQKTPLAHGIPVFCAHDKIANLDDLIQLKRRYFAIEIDPGYVAVSLQRD